MRNPSAPDRPVPAQVLRKIGAYLLKRAGLLAETRCTRAEALKLADGPVAQTITATAVAEQADTIVMGSRGLSPIEALGFGSASQEVFRSAPCTCIAVH
jgi:nucleotide-binding universal stress UspA family protein